MIDCAQGRVQIDGCPGEEREMKRTGNSHKVGEEREMVQMDGGAGDITVQGVISRETLWMTGKAKQ